MAPRRAVADDIVIEHRSGMIGEWTTRTRSDVLKTPLSELCNHHGGIYKHDKGYVTLEARQSGSADGDIKRLEDLPQSLIQQHTVLCIYDIEQHLAQKVTRVTFTDY